MMYLIVISASVFFISVVLTWVVRRYALMRGVLDIPNSRSSHQAPVPRGGGLAILLAFLVGILALVVAGSVHASTSVSLALAGVTTGAVGFWDDHAQLSARLRLAAHFAAAAAALAILGGMTPIHILGSFVLPVWMTQIFAVFVIVWLLNLYNFMDGVDGLAGTEALTVALGGAVANVAAGYPQGSVVCLVLAAASAGFLVWNLPPAKIFMGDVGSGFLGVTFGVIAVDAARVSPALFWSWLILLGAFIVDATVTLLRRLMRRERVYLPHRSHAYQHAARRLGAHGPVAFAFGAINLLWLAPLAIIVASDHLPGEVGLFIAWLPLVVAALRGHAGLPDVQPATRKSPP